VEFINVHVERDNRIFLDPSAIRNSRGNYARRAQRTLENFFDEVLRCRRSGSASVQAKGLSLLQNLHEPNETRLGMSRVGVQGHGFGDDLGGVLWDELGANAACRTAAVSRLEDIKLFVKGVGDDLISDMATRVAYKVLADFTADMVAKHPQLTSRGTTTFTATVWNTTNKDWDAATVTLPNVPPHPLLLVPLGWVYWRMLLDPTAYYNRHATGTLQEEESFVGGDGRIIKPTKASLKQAHPDVRRLNDSQTVKYIQQGQNLVERYRAEIDAEYVPLTDEDVQGRTE
jgi:hypothetical protein